MRKQYDDFTQMKLKDMCKSMSDMTYTYINPDNGQPTKVPPSHYEKILEAVKENYMGEITSRQFLTIMYNQLNALKKEDEKYFRQALLCIDMGINPKDLRLDERIAISFTDNYIDDKQKQEKKNFHLLSQDIVDTYNESKESPFIQARAMEVSNEIDEEDNDIDYGY
ncbi:MAG: hypothetical protein HFJ29_03315 [Clostridia bacterium]|nr:hypothetical protein [Clostridia bacterium]